MRTNERIGNEVTDRARIQIRFCSHFSFSTSPFPVLHYGNIPWCDVSGRLGQRSESVVKRKLLSQ